MTALSHFPVNDLVLRLTGGQRDGELIPVKTHKCFLGIEESYDGDVVEQPQYAIFRGPDGAAVRSYGDNVSVNGIASTVHWLKEGDRIEFPNSVTVEVAQLGWVESACQKKDEAQDDQSDPESECYHHRDPLADQTQGVQEIGWEADDHQQDPQDQQEPEAELPESNPETLASERQAFAEHPSLPYDERRVELIESQVKGIETQNCLIQRRFDQLEDRLGTLSEQIFQLVSLSQVNVDHARGQEESFAAPNTWEQQLAVDQSESESRHEEASRYQEESQRQEESQCQEESLCEEEFVHDPMNDSTDPGGADQETILQPLSDLYSHLDDDEEKILTFDQEPEIDAVDALNSDAEFRDAQPEMNVDTLNQIDSRLSEMERVFGGSFAETDADRIESSIEHTANEQPLESFDTPTHGLNEGFDSFADYTMPGMSETPEPGSLASQLLGDIAFDDQPLDEQQVEENSEETAAAVEPASNSTSSVADLLARMKAEGQWSGIPADDEFDESPSEPVVAASAEPLEPVESVESADDVDDYMSQLLNRMRAGEPISQVKRVVAQAPPKPKAETAEGEIEFVPPKNPLKPDEFKPARKAQKFELSAMRELANSTSRNAVHASEKIRRKELGYVQIGIAVCSFFMAIYYFLVNSKAFMDTGFLVGLICTGTAGFLGFRFYLTMRFNEMMESITGNEKKTSQTAKTRKSMKPVAETNV